MASNFYQFFLVFMIYRNSLQQNIESSINYDPIPAHLKKQIHKITYECFLSCTYNKAMIIVHIYTISDRDEHI